MADALSVIPSAVLRNLSDKLYEKRKNAALELATAGDHEKIPAVINLLTTEFTNSPQANHRKGGLIGLAAATIGLTSEAAQHLEQILPPVLYSFSDQDSRVRYYACEALYNIAKVVRGDFMFFFNQIFDALCKLSSDADANVQSAAHLLDRLVKDIVTKSDQFSIEEFIPLLRERMNVLNPYVRQFLVGWITVLDSVPDIDTQPLVGSHEAVIAVESSRTQEEADPAESAGNDDDAQSMVGSLEVEMAIELSSNVDHRTQDRRNGWTQKVSLEWMFVISNFILELPSAVLDQLSSEHKPRYILFAMLISFATLLICIVELIYIGRKLKVHWKWRGMLPWFYHPSQNNKPFGSFKDIFGSVCALCQCIVTAVNYAHSDHPIKISVWPIIFAFGLLFSKSLENPERRTIS